jgi:sirohydrochlorin ferrochelatase
VHEETSVPPMAEQLPSGAQTHAPAVLSATAQQLPEQEVWPPVTNGHSPHEHPSPPSLVRHANGSQAQREFVPLG